MLLPWPPDERIFETVKARTKSFHLSQLRWQNVDSQPPKSAVQGLFIFLLSYGIKPASILRCILCQKNHTISKQLRFTLRLHERDHVFREGLMAPKAAVASQKKDSEIFMQSQIRAAIMFITYTLFVSEAGGHV